VVKGNTRPRKKEKERGREKGQEPAYQRKGKEAG
jgi:hypothetical protein